MSQGQPFFLPPTTGGGTTELEVSDFGQLSMVFGSNPSTTTAVYAQIADDNEAYASILVPPGGTFSYAPADGGRKVIAPLFLGSSTTPTTYTASTIDLLWNAQGRQA